MFDARAVVELINVIYYHVVDIGIPRINYFEYLTYYETIRPFSSYLRVRIPKRCVLGSCPDVVLTLSSLLLYSVKRYKCGCK